VSFNFLYFIFLLTPVQMASLNWQDKDSAPKGAHSSLHSQSNPWFAVSMGLVGVIVGFGIAQMNVLGKSAEANTVQPIAQAPVAPTAPTAAVAQAPQPSGKPPAPVDAQTDRIRGDLSKAKVALIEYSDFECPFCKRHFPTMQQVVSTYGDKVALVYRDFPLSFHQNAHKEAEAGKCIFELGGNDAFWKYHDYVFTNTTSNGTGFALDQLPVAAKQAGVDAAKFQTCLDSGKYVKAVDDQEAEGQSAGVSGTPGNFVVDLATQKSTTISGAYPFSAFQAAIDPLVK
jgi:protein-disulfide isomerase